MEGRFTPKNLKLDFMVGAYYICATLRPLDFEDFRDQTGFARKNRIYKMMRVSPGAGIACLMDGLWSHLLLKTVCSYKLKGYSMIYSFTGWDRMKG